MARIRVNHRLAITIIAMIGVVAGAFLLKSVLDRSARAAEGSMLRDATHFLLEKAIDDSARFVPLAPEAQREFEQRFRDRNGTPIIYDPWTPGGALIERDEAHRYHIVAYTLNLTPDGDRAVVTADLGIAYVPDTQIDWSQRLWTAP